MHLLRCAFKQAAASRSKQCVAAEQMAAVIPGWRQIEGDVMGGVPRHGQHFNGATQQFQLISPLHRQRLQRDAGLIGATGDHARLGPAL
jgi:hypothetical protein